MDARGVHRLKVTDRTLQFALERAMEVDPLGERAPPQLRLIEELEAHARPAGHRADRELKPRVVNAVRVHKDAPRFSQLVLDVLGLQGHHSGLGILRVHPTGDDLPITFHPAKDDAAEPYQRD